MKNILVPTDLAVQSLDAIYQLVKKNQNQKLRIHLVHMVATPTDLSDLLFLKKGRLYDEVPRAFYHEIEQLKKAYPLQLESIRLQFYYGDRAVILQDIVENLQIDEICILDSYKYKLPLKQSVNMLPFIDRCMVPVFKAPVYGRLVLQGSSRKTTHFVTHQYSEGVQ